mmetsp:Transcript_19105/g.58821  ORF Transcript_19105/g.58821 Transcript_19105/m.58821 type:complete len:342 (+) Transcript_19105:1514-2539(+)
MRSLGIRSLGIRSLYGPLRYGPLLALVAAATAADDVCASSGPPWFSAAPAAKTYELERAGFDVCALCGGAERLGAVVDVDASHPTEDVAKEVLDAVRAHGVIIVKGQSLSRAEQVAFTAALGEVVVLPHSFEGKDPEPLHPEIQRVTNFFANGTWKGPATKFGAYWHQDGQFWLPPRHNVLSVLHCQSAPPAGGETGFADLRAALATLSKPLRDRAALARIVASVRDIADFAKGDPEDLDKFPNASHAFIQPHALDGGPTLYVGSPHMVVEGLPTPEAGRDLLTMVLKHATSPSFTYFHAWQPGDLIVWDNTQTLHHSMPYDSSSPDVVRELYRTQARFVG